MNSAPYALMSTTTVESIMTSNPSVVSPDATVSSAAAKMKDLGVRHLPVTLGVRLVGIVSSQDLTREGWSVADIMTPRPTCIEPSMEVARAAAKMAAMKVSCMPVVSHGRLVGIVTSFDLLQALNAPSPPDPADSRLTVQSVLTPDPVVVPDYS